MAIMAMNSTVVYDNPQHTSGSFTLLASDCAQQGWYYYFEVTGLPLNSLVKIDCNYNDKVYAEIYNESDEWPVSGDGPGSTSSSISTSTGKLCVYIQDEWMGGPYSFTFKFSTGSYAANTDSYIHGNSIIDGNVGIGTTYTSGKLTVANNNRSFGLVSGSSCNSTSPSYGIYSSAYNFSGPVYGIYSHVYGGGTSNQRYSGYFNGGDVAVMNGKMGLGTETPNWKLDIQGTGLNAGIHLGKTDNVTASWYLHPGRLGTGELTIANDNIYALTILPNGNVGIGTPTPFSKLDVTGEIRSTLNGIANIRMSCGNYSSMLRNDAVSTYFLLTNNNDVNGGWNSLRPFRINNSTGDVAFADEKFQIAHSTGTIIAAGKIGIGLTDAATKLAASPADELLTVNGTIHAKEVKVDLTGSLADYVFNSDYSLMPLHKVEAFVKTNKHLPEIPSAAEVKEKGLSMGEMQNKLLQKIEELTLYVIEQQKRIDQLEKSQK
jgi:hypothetical protein